MTPPSPRDLMIAELTRRAAELGPLATPLDVVADEIENGSDITKLAKELGVKRMTLSRYIKQLGSEATSRIADARRDGAHALIERSEEMLTNAPTDSREALQKVKWLADLLERRAEKANPQELGGAARVAVQLNVGALHLQAMQRRSVATAVASPALSAAETIEIVDAEIVA